ncbi:MAG: InlB B-repeat-containing protein [Prevotella sp.]|nr:InlB B-repeat-containing protein [Prevotella sp.]
MKKTITFLSARAAMMLLTTLLLTMTAQTAWADNVTLSVDNDYNNTDVGYYYAKMPNSPNVKSTLTLNEEGVTACNGAFKLYDSGGKNGNYNAEKDYGTKFTIEVPDDYVLNITGSSRSTYDHNWNIYDSSDTDDSKLLINLRQENNDIDVTTTGKYVTIYFQAPTSSNRQYSQWGLNLTVKLLSAKNSIPLSTITGIKRVYKRTGSAISLGYTVKSLSNVTLTKDVDFTETITKNGTVVDNAVENGDYTLTIAGKYPYFGKQTFDFSVSDNDYISVSSDTKVMYNCAYKVQQNVTISDRIVVNGDVTLTLEEGYTLTAQDGIEVEAGNTLTIDGTGSLTIPTGPNYCAGIGSNNGKEYGHIIINGGIITTQGGQYGAGIGGGNENVDNGNCCITINGGVINATGDANAAGIGGGYGGAYDNNPRGAAGTIIINGGQVTALQKSFSGSTSTHCGIGHGYMYSGGGGSLTLDWTRESDFIDCFKYNITNINFGGKGFVLDEDITVTATISNIDGKKIIPKLDDLVLNHATINNLCPLYRYTGNEIALGYSIKSTDGTTTLVKGTDYSEAITKGGVTSIVKDKGEYTLTITGLGSYYTGTKSYTFSVADIDEDLTQDGSEYYVNFPADGTTKTVNLIENQTIKVYDSEGKNGSLVTCDGYLLLQAPDGYALEVTGKTDAMRYNTANSLWVNSLSAYEGDNTTNEIIKLLTNSDNILFASGGKVMRMRLNVTALYTFASQYGLDLTVRVIPQQLNTITKGTVSNGSIDIADNKTTANTNEMITLTVNPAEGYLLKRITITDTDGGSTLQTIGEDQWYSGENTVSFKMPSRNVTITPEFTNSLTAAGGLSMNIDLSGTKECVIPEIVQSFNIRASAVDNPTGWGYATIILRAHNEYSLQATGQIEFINVSTDGGEISIYDGANTSATPLTNIKGASKETVSIGTQTSSSNYMTIYLSEEGPYNSVFTGTIETQIKNYSITYDLTGGSVATENPTTYNYKTDDFTLTNPTRDGYTFAGWTGTGLGAASTSVTVTKGNTGTRSYTATWTENIATLDEGATPLAELTAMNGKQTKVNFTRSGLTAGAYSTICLPYNFTASETCTFYKFDGVKKVGDDWVADISTTTGGTANTPYIFTTDATSVTFSNNAVVAASSYSDTDAKTTITDWTFQGTYSQISLPKTGEYDYGFAAGDGSKVAIGTFVHLKSGASAAPFRAYLRYTGSDANWAKAPNRAGAANDAMPSRIIVRIVGADGGTTDIGTLDTRTGEISTGEWFDLNGRRLQGKPSTKGVYINNGKKVVIK